MRRDLILILTTMMLLSSCGEAPDSSYSGKNPEKSDEISAEEPFGTALETTASYDTDMTEPQTTSSQIIIESSEEEERDTEKDTNENWIDAYRNILNSDDLALTCSLYDITGDGIPELFVSGSLSHFTAVNIYSFSDNDTKQIKCFFDTTEYVSETETPNYSFGSSGEIYYFPSLGLCDSYMGSMIGWSNTMFSIEGDNAEVEFSSFNEQIEANDSNDYYINEEKVNRDEYTEAVSPYAYSEYITLGRTYYVDRERAKTDEFYDQKKEYVDDVFEEIEKNGFKNPDLPSVSGEVSWKLFGIFD